MLRICTIWLFCACLAVTVPPLPAFTPPAVTQMLPRGHRHQLPRNSLPPPLPLSAAPCPSHPPVPESSPLFFNSTFVGLDGNLRGFSNWVVPGKLMLGRYPHRYPAWSKSGAPTREEAREHLRRVLEAGVDTFVCLQSEVPAQDDEEGWGEMGPHPGGERVQSFVPRKMVEREAAEGIEPRGFWRYQGDAIALSRSLGREEGPAFYHLPIPDFSTPDPGVLRTFLEGVLRGRGGGVYLHCWAGRGRAGTVGACMALMMGEAGDAEEALRLVQEGYDTRAREEGGASCSPETDGQRDFVRSFVP